MKMKFANRIHAAQLLAEKLQDYKNRSDVIVLALPRGGVPMGVVLANQLKVDLDIIIVRKLGVPGHEELAMGAIAINDTLILNNSIISGLGISAAAIEEVKKQQLQELQRRNQYYRKQKSFPDLQNKTVIIVDDGLATGATMKAAVAAIKSMSPQYIIISVPVAAAETCAELSKKVDKMICLSTPEIFYAVGQWYDYFEQVSDAEVCELLAEQWGQA